MVYSIQNDRVTVKIDSHGAEMISAVYEGCEYIWQADPKYWAGHSPVLFPIFGRLFEGKYTYEGKTYEMTNHGFARHSEFEVVKKTDSEITLGIKSSDETKAVYPFDFEFYMTYSLAGTSLRIEAQIKNTGESILPATYGGHPAFRVPLDGGSFEDYYLEFSEVCSPDQIMFSDRCLCTGRRQALALEGGKILRLKHSLFDNDAIFMSRQADSVTLRSDKDTRTVTLMYAGMPYLGVWHTPKSDAPFVCIEPVCGLPSYDGETDDFAKKNDMFRLPAGEETEISYEIVFG